jgi:hypothetical protein
MTLGEAYLKDVLRTPPTTHLPPPTPHPFQKSFYTYVTKKALPKHWFLLAGAGFMLTLYGTLDGLRESGKKSAYDAAVMAGQTPCEWVCMALQLRPSDLVPATGSSIDSTSATSFCLALDVACACLLCSLTPS